MKKLFIMSHGLSANGIDSFVTNIVKAFDKSKYDVSVVLALDEDNVQLREGEVQEAGVKIYRTCDLGSIKRMLTHAKKLYRILKEQKPDIFHANMDLLNGINLVVAWLAGVPVRVCHSHTSSSQYEKKTGKHIVVSIYRWFMRTLCSVFSNRKCGCSDPAMTYLYGAKWKQKKNTYLVNNGIDLRRFAANREPSSDTVPTIVTVGRISAVKNPLFALDVIESLYQLRQDFRYIWIGQGELMDEVRKTIEQKNLPCVELLGARGDVDRLLPQYDVFLLPSLFEGLPISLIEAQAAGLPCVISDTITREIDCGGCHYLSLEASSAQWAQVLSDILDKKIECDIDWTKLEKFDTQYTVKQLDEIYEA